VNSPANLYEQPQPRWNVQLGAVTEFVDWLAVDVIRHRVSQVFIGCTRVQILDEVWMVFQRGLNAQVNFRLGDDGLKRDRLDQIERQWDVGFGLTLTLVLMGGAHSL
jgi:hypothetical protein